MHAILRPHRCALQGPTWEHLPSQISYLLTHVFDAQVFRSWPDMRSCSESLSPRKTQARSFLSAPRRRMSQPEPGRAFPMSAGWDLAFSRPVTGDYPAVV